MKLSAGGTLPGGVFVEGIFQRGEVDFPAISEKRSDSNQNKQVFFSTESKEQYQTVRGNEL